MTIIAADNGLGNWTIMRDGQVVDFFEVPTFKHADRKKSKVSYTTRIDTKKLTEKLMLSCVDRANARAFVERPLINPVRFKSSVVGIRAYEAVLIVLEDLCIGYERVDSRTWQRDFWPAPEKGKKNNTKSLSRNIACQLFPHLKEQIEKSDGDSLLMAEWARRRM